MPVTIRKGGSAMAIENGEWIIRGMDWKTLPYPQL
jgi:hypothetical protein